MKAKKLVEISLGIVTGIGGFLDVGTLATSADAGAAFGFQLLWVVVAGTFCLVLLTEMSGRFTAVTRESIVDATRETFGFAMFFPVLAVIAIGTWLVLAAEIAGTALALQFATGLAYRWWVLPVAGATWLVLWASGFGKIEKGGAIIALITLAFVVAAVVLHPPLRDVARGLIPSRPRADHAHYWFSAAGILGATLTPYVFYFYSAGAEEDRWTRNDLPLNRLVAGLGMGLGGVLSAAIVVVAAMTLHPVGIHVDSYDQVAITLIPPFPRWGFWIFVTCFFVVAFTSAVEIALALAYMVAQGFGWNWGKNVRPRDAARFTALYSLAILTSACFLFLGVDPLGLTMMSMAIASATLPFTTVPFLVLMNQPRLGTHRNSWVTNVLVLVVVALAFVLAVVSIPLAVVGG